MKVSLPPRRVWLEWLKNVASALIVTVSVGAGAVIAASESQQPTAGCAVALLCGAFGHCRGALQPQTPITRDAIVQSLAHPDP